MNSKNFRLLAVAAVTLCAALAAHATPGGEGGNTGCNGQGNPNSPCTGQGGAGGAGGAGGTGGTGVGVGIGVGVATAAAQANASATAIAAQQQAQMQAQTQGQQQAQQALGGAAEATGGAAIANGGQGSGNKTLTSVAVDASTHIERSAPAIAVQGGTPLPTGCRYVFGVGGSNANGSVGASGIPLWKDSECKGAAVFSAASRFPGVFTVADLQQVACENFDAMENTPTCRNLRSRQRAEGEAIRQQAVNLYGN